MPDQPQIVKYRQQRFVHPTPLPLPAFTIVRNLEAKAEQEASRGSSVENQRQPEAQSDETLERKDSVVSQPVSESPFSEPFDPPARIELRVDLQPSEHTQNHFYTLGALEAGLSQETSGRKVYWRRFFC
jgi:hypothetical protein